MPFDEFPWFKDQPVKAIINVEEPSPGHFYWPDIDVDLTQEIIEYPEQFPNKAKKHIMRQLGRSQASHQFRSCFESKSSHNLDVSSYQNPHKSGLLRTSQTKKA